MKRLSITLLALLLIGGPAFSQTVQLPTILNSKQVSQLDVTGKWTGKRQQYSWDRKTFIETFQYEFDLKQEGNIVTGTSTIINANGEYADMIVEGVIIGNKLHFAEKQVKSAIRPEGRVWCFKSGELYFAKEGDNLKLTGATPSYMENNNMPCSGGVTNLIKADNNNDLSSIMNTTTTNSVSTGISPDINISVYPNPFVQTSKIQYNLITDSKVQVEVFDMSGKRLSTLFDGNQKAGNYYNLNFNAQANSQNSGIYIVKLTINGEVYSRQLVQML